MAERRRGSDLDCESPSLSRDSSSSDGLESLLSPKSRADFQTRALVEAGTHIRDTSQSKRPVIFEELDGSLSVSGPVWLRGA